MDGIGSPQGGSGSVAVVDRPKRVVLGVSGGIAAYKAVEVCRRLVDSGVHVVPVLTRNATRFVGEITFSALASEPAITSLWNGREPIPHTRLGQAADLVVVVPATAGFLAHYANGFADDILEATLVATRAPVVVCPAMHTEMWEHPAVRDNIATLRRRGVHVIEPVEGRLAGSDSGAGRLADPADIAAVVMGLLERVTEPGDLAGVKVLVSAGGTREAIDPVRVITNRSSGKQGFAIAEVAVARGAAVTVVSTVEPRALRGIEVLRVETAAEMERAMYSLAPACDVVVMAAAVADFRPKMVADSKLSKADGVPEIVLEQTPDILAGLARHRRPGQVLVGFAAEAGGDVAVKAAAKMAAKGVDVMVANDVLAPGAGFDHDTNEVVIVGSGGEQATVGLSSKQEVAAAVLDMVVERLRAVGRAGQENS